MVKPFSSGPFSDSSRPLRAMWLLNHTTARKFEVPLLKRIGVQEIFLPKIVPADPAFRSASVDWSEDQNLTIPSDDLAVLNQTNWYVYPSADAWRVANRHFDLLFFILVDIGFFRSMSRHFHGAKIWRTYGLTDPPKSYGRVMEILQHREPPSWTVDSGRNLWFGEAYDHLADVEPRWIADRAVYLPAGLSNTEIRDQWTGEDKRILFVCPDLAFNSYYQDVYQEFKKMVAGIPYVVGGAQPVRVEDDRVLGYLPVEQHEQNMRRLAVMYYHGTEPNHVHYHPFEAVRAGMPLVFLAGGLLDKLGGADLPGRCASPEEARKKIERILGGDRPLIEQIRTSQVRLLDTMRVSHCEPIWQTAIERILHKLELSRVSNPAVASRKKKVGIIVPVEYRGGTLRGAKLLARALTIGSVEDGEEIEVVFGHLDGAYRSDEFDDLPVEIERRPFRWRTMSAAEANRACTYAGQRGTLSDSSYIVPGDGINQFVDCDLWIVISDRLSVPLLPIKPYLMVVYDYVQRYARILSDDMSQQFINRAHAAEAVIVTTDTTARDALQFAGLPERKIKRLPLLAPEFTAEALPENAVLPEASYFVWTTNLAAHKNHEKALEALARYYEKYDGVLDCHVTGVNTSELFKSDLPHLRGLQRLRRSSKRMKECLHIAGELPDYRFRAELRAAAFLWHPARYDNGTFSVIEAASLGVPSLSSDYPAMREIDRQFSLNLSWADPDRPDEMARQLKFMEINLAKLRERLPPRDVLADQALDRTARKYWHAIKEFL